MIILPVPWDPIRNLHGEAAIAYFRKLLLADVHLATLLPGQRRREWDEVVRRMHYFLFDTATHRLRTGGTPLTTLENTYIERADEAADTFATLEAVLDRVLKERPEEDRAPVFEALRTARLKAADALDAHAARRADEYRNDRVVRLYMAMRAVALIARTKSPIGATKNEREAVARSAQILGLLPGSGLGSGSEWVRTLLGRRRELVTELLREEAEQSRTELVN